MTLEEAVKTWTVDADDLMNRYRSICEEASRNPELLHSVLALRDSPSMSSAILSALKMGLIIGMEMEKAR